MTIEEEFFKTFGIEPKKTQQIVGNGVFFNVIEDEYYPEITAEKLLKLICILNENTGRLIELVSSNFDDLKNEILQICISNYEAFRISYKDKFKQQVRKLFIDEYLDIPCEFVCGYAKKNDKDKRLKAKIKTIYHNNGLYSDLKIDKLVYDIEFELIKD